MDFYQIKERSAKNGVTEIYPDFKVGRSKDLMVRGKSFYAIWDPEQEMWSTDEYDVQRLVDAELLAHKEKVLSRTDGAVNVKLMSEFSTTSWTSFRKFMQNISDNSHQLDEILTFANTEVKKKDYVSRRLPYPLEPGSFEAYDEIIGTLYEPEERAKLEWAIGAVVAGDAKTIQKFIVLYGEAGAGKSTILNIIQKLFEGYYTTFEAKALTSASNSFSTEVFKANPLVAIQHDGDLSKIEDNTKLNSIISHEEMTMNEKYKPSYMARVNCFLFMATNRPVKITDGKSGIIRRLIDVRPSGKRIPSKRYQALMLQIDFELGAIASHCLEVYRDMGKQYYSAYRPLDMMLQTDVFFNFIESNYYFFKEQDGATLSQAYDMYKIYCDEALVDFKLPRHKFREELKNYFRSFADVTRVDGKQIRSYYSGFILDKFKSDAVEKKDEKPNSLVLDCHESLFDLLLSDCYAQYASTNDIPGKRWDDVTTKLSDIDTKEVHYVKVPDNHIVIDFDLKDDNGEKSLEKNIEAASKWPPTYSEFSKSGRGVHLHYIYEGDVTKLSRVYDDYIEVKVFTGKSSLRRKLTMCNNIPFMTINSGLPLKGEKVINSEVVKSEIALRNLIKRNINKEIHQGTKPSMDFIYKILEDAYASGLVYDVTDMRPEILIFANNSSNQADYCIKLIGKMKFQSEKESLPEMNYSADELIFFDVEVFPNLFIVVWKAEGKPPVKMINPEPKAIEELMRFKLVGFNCRRYDNHILYGRYIGYSIEQVYKLSQRIIGNSKNAAFREAYNVSYTDIYDFLSVKSSLKKLEIELGIHKQELGFKWTEPVPEDKWDIVADYCVNDVVATEATFKAKRQDYVARLILSELSGLSPNDTTQQHTAKIIFGNDQDPQSRFVYTDLSVMFPGYVFSEGKSSYKNEDPGEGGYVYAEPGIYENVALLDVASMHPNSLINMNMFGPYTKNFKQLLDARMAIKHKDFDKAKKMLNGILAKYLNSEEDAAALAYALKIVINIVYGLTSASFDSKFKDPRNIDNIVAKRGALFMLDLKQAVQDQGYVVAHIKTDSIKIPDATPEIIKFVMDFGKKYGYTFEHEDTFEKICLVNDAVYIAKKQDKIWSATGAQFAQPYVFKTLFTQDPIEFSDLCEVKAVSTALYLDMNEKLPEGEHDYYFVGKVGEFCPIKPGHGGGILLREKEEKYFAASGSKGYRWLESEMVKALGKEEYIDRDYYRAQVDDAVKTISKFGDFEWFIS
jgi:energy-coupling factor transporter ATP-binding protein EcfA2